jgi:hypothetical protein
MKISQFNGGVPAIPGGLAHLTGGVQLPAGGLVRADSLVFPQELTFVTGRERERYRPLFWRDILDVEPAPSWARVIEDRQIRTLTEDPVNITQKGPTEELPMPSFSVSKGTFTLFSFGLAYGVTDGDIEYAQRLGINISDENVYGCNLAFEQFLERVAVVGDTPTGMVGLGNLSGISTATATTKAATGTTWAVATALEMVKDLHILCDSVYVNTKQLNTATDVALPIAQWNLLNETLTTALERTALEVFKAQKPNVRFHVWDRLSTQGTGVTPCAMAWDRNDRFRPKMVIAREATYGQPLRGLNGYLVPGQIKIGGVVCRNTVGVSKMSGL